MRKVRIRKKRVSDSSIPVYSYSLEELEKNLKELPYYSIRNLKNKTLRKDFFDSFFPPLIPILLINSIVLFLTLMNGNNYQNLIVDISIVISISIMASLGMFYYAISMVNKNLSMRINNKENAELIISKRPDIKYLLNKWKSSEDNNEKGVLEDFYYDLISEDFNIEHKIKNMQYEISQEESYIRSYQQIFNSLIEEFSNASKETEKTTESRENEDE